jgi:formylglycine-generating enzyme required for sulfatase activity
MTALGRAPQVGSYRDGERLPEMVIVPAGQFWMGATGDDDKFSSIVEKPRHLVSIDYPLAVGRFPVTFDEWNVFARDSCCREKFPVCNVSWNDTQAYLNWLSKRTGREYRLLSEAEWEYCCRAGTTSVFATGENISIEQANFLYLDFGDQPGLGRPVPVGSYSPNAFGLFDMHGSVCELVADSWHDHYSGAPTDGSSWDDPHGSPWRVVRGGGWDAMPRILRSAFRDWVGCDQWMDNMGFRVACTL